MACGEEEAPSAAGLQSNATNHPCQAGGNHTAVAVGQNHHHHLLEDADAIHSVGRGRGGMKERGTEQHWVSSLVSEILQEPPQGLQP